MNLYQRDLRTERLPFEIHLPGSAKLLVVGFYILLGIGLAAVGAYSLRLWDSNRQAAALRQDILSADEQQRMLDSVIDRLNQRRELVTDIQAWLQSRFDLESLYHECAGLVPSYVLMQSFSVRHLPETSVLEFAIAVEGEPDTYNPFFRALTSYFSSTTRMKIADIQIDLQRGGALLSLQILTDREGIPAGGTLPRLSHHASSSAP